MQVGFVGLGNIGHPMATNILKAGFKIAVHDVDRRKGEKIIALGANWADTPAAVSEGADVVITSLPGPPEVSSVVEGPNGILSTIRKGSAYIDMTTNSVQEIRRLGDIMAAHGVSMLDSPVTGGIENAWKGRTTMFVGGDRIVFDRVRPILKAIGENVHYIGRLGAGASTKLITNMIAFTQILILGEGFVLGARSGLDIAALWEAIVASTASSYIARYDMPLLFAGNYDPSFSLKLVCKDIRLAVELARNLDVPVELAALTEQICNRARVQYGDEEGVLSIIKLIEDLTKTPLRTTLSSTP